MSNVYMGTDVEDFIFGEGTVYEDCDNEDNENIEVDDVTEEEMNVRGVIECVDDPDVACYRIALENEQNYNAIMNAMMIREYTVLESTGSEMVYEAANAEGFFKAVNATLDTFWAKIKGVYKKVNDVIAGLVTQNKAFVKKYKGAKMEMPTKETKFTGYDFTKMPDKSIYATIVDLLPLKSSDIKKAVVAHDEETANQIVTKFQEEFAAKKDMMRGAACGDLNKSIASEDFAKELRLAFFGSEKKVELKLPAFADLMKELESAKTARDDVKKSYKDAEKSLKQLKVDIKSAQNELKKTDGRKNSGMKVAKCMTDAVNAATSIMSRTLSVQTSAIITSARQAGAMAAFYVTHQPKKQQQKVDHASTSMADDLDVNII